MSFRIIGRRRAPALFALSDDELAGMARCAPRLARAGLPCGISLMTRGLATRCC